MASSGETVRVIVRCRPMNQRETDLKCQVRLVAGVQNDVERIARLDDHLHEHENQSSLARERRSNERTTETVHLRRRLWGRFHHGESLCRVRLSPRRKRMSEVHIATIDNHALCAGVRRLQRHGVCLRTNRVTIVTSAEDPDEYRLRFQLWEIVHNARY